MRLLNETFQNDSVYGKLFIIQDDYIILIQSATMCRGKQGVNLIFGQKNVVFEQKKAVFKQKIGLSGLKTGVFSSKRDLPPAYLCSPSRIVSK